MAIFIKKKFFRNSSCASLSLKVQELLRRSGESDVITTSGGFKIPDSARETWSSGEV
jgi:hypothetical protein